MSLLLLTLCLSTCFERYENVCVGKKKNKTNTKGEAEQAELFHILLTF